MDSQPDKDARQSFLRRAYTHPEPAPPELFQTNGLPITVVGSINMDLVIETPRFPAAGETVMGNAFRECPGGKGANQAVAAANMKAPVNLIGVVGPDYFGRELVDCLKSNGVNISRVVTTKARTGTAMILVDDAGRNQIVVMPGANERLRAEHIADRATMIHGSHALLAQLEVPLVAVQAALEVARAAQVITILNPAPVRPLTDEVLRLCDYLIPNESEASQLSGVEVRDVASAQHAAERLRARSGGNVIITLGAQGAWLSTSEFTGHVPAFKVQPVDTVGAGDTFIGAFAVRLVEGASVLEAARFASAAAALAVTRRGAQDSIPGRPQVENFLRANA